MYGTKTELDESLQAHGPVKLACKRLNPPIGGAEVTGGERGKRIAPADVLTGQFDNLAVTMQTS